VDLCWLPLLRSNLLQAKYQSLGALQEPASGHDDGTEHAGVRLGSRLLPQPKRLLVQVLVNRRDLHQQMPCAWDCCSAQQ
jgi:hypothetical protein